MEISQDGNYPITIDEAVDYFGVNPNSHAVTTQSMRLDKTACFTVEKYNSPLSYPCLKQRKLALNLLSDYFLQRRSSGSCWK